MHSSSNQSSNSSGDLAEAAVIHKDDDDPIAKGLGFTVAAIFLLLVITAVVYIVSSENTDAPHITTSEKTESTHVAPSEKTDFFKYIVSLGPMGDYIAGILNPIISGCTLLVAYAVWKLQKIELAATKNELQIQRGQQRFFDLMNVYYRTVDSISASYIRPIRIKSPEYKSFIEGRTGNPPDPRRAMDEVGSESIQINGKAAIARKVIELEFEVDDDNEFYPNEDWSEIINHVVESPENYDDRFLEFFVNKWIFVQSDLGLSQYFRIIDLLLTMTPQLLDNEDHWRYVELFIAQLSDDELVMLAYYVWLDYSGQKLVCGGKKYGLLKNMSSSRKKIFSRLLPPELFVATSSITNSVPC